MAATARRLVVREGGDADHQAAENLLEGEGGLRLGGGGAKG